ncbi:MAG TPA: hypothetical protein VL086_16980 [Candidatus Nitrosotalea sp.]|nr:hypothetical protein [Candidatus Nitrosotalea sp.]
MRYRQTAILIALYVTFDLTNPFVGCAFNFEADESMDGVARQHEPLLYETGAVALPVPAGGDNPGLARPLLGHRLGSRALAEWFVQLRQAHAPHSDPQSPTEDH